MKLRNKKTGEIRDIIIFGNIFLIEAKDFPNDTTIIVKTLAELNEEWEDCKEYKDDWEKMQAGEWNCACCYTYLEPIDSTHVICPRCGLRHRFKNGVIQTKGNNMKDYDE